MHRIYEKNRNKEFYEAIIRFIITFWLTSTWERDASLSACN